MLNYYFNRIWFALCLFLVTVREAFIYYNGYGYEYFWDWTDERLPMSLGLLFAAFIAGSPGNKVWALIREEFGEHFTDEWEGKKRPGVARYYGIITAVVTFIISYSWYTTLYGKLESPESWFDFIGTFMIFGAMIRLAFYGVMQLLSSSGDQIIGSQKDGLE